jgi:mannose-6-phosphate isomerase-like protein (cupin superfamily)
MIDLERDLTHRASGEGRTYWLIEDRITVKITGEQTLGAYAMIEGVVPPGGGTPPHVHHREDEAFYVLEGEVTFYSGGREVTVRPGGFLHGPKGVPHHFRNNGDVPAKMLTTASPPGFEKFVAEAGVPVEESPAPPAPGPETFARLSAAAEKYGIELLPPPVEA